MLKRALRPVLLCLGLALFGAVIWQSQVWEVVMLTGGLSWPWLAATVLMNIPVVLLWALRARVVLEAMGQKPPIRSLAAIAIIGNSASILTPGRVGDAIRAVLLNRIEEVPWPQAITLIIYEKPLVIIMGALGSVWVAVLSIAQLSPWVYAICLAAWVPAAVLSIAVIRLLWRVFRGIALPLLSRMLTRFSQSEAVTNSPTRVADYLDELLSSQALSCRFVVVAASVFMCSALQFKFVLAALSIDLPLPVAWLSVGGTMVVTTIISLPFGIGVFEGGIAGILAVVGVSLQTGAASALLLRACTTVPMTLVAAGTYVFLTRRIAASGREESRRGSEIVVDESPL